MIGLITSEWQRVRLFALMGFVLHGLVLAALANYGLLFANNLGLNVALTSVYGCVAAIFGVHQVRNYSQAGDWVFLINRPLPPSLIFLSLSITASAMIIVVLVAPWMIATCASKIFSSNVIELRHFLLWPYLYFIATSFYLAGATFALSRNTLVATILWLPLLGIISLHVGGSVFLLITIVTVWMLVLTLLYFKPALATRPQKGWQVCVVAVAIQLSCFLAFTAIAETARQIIEQNVSVQSRNDASSAKPGVKGAAASYQQVVRMEGRQKVIAGLSGLPEKQIELISRSVRTNDVHQVKKAVSFLPTRQQIPFIYSRGMTLIDDDHATVWEFSHSKMQFIGHNRDTKRFVGWLGPAGISTAEKNPSDAGCFSFVPWIAGMQLACGNKLYRFNDQSQTIELLFVLPEGQMYQAPLVSRGSLYSLLSERELYLFDGIEVRKDVLPLCTLARIQLPGDYNNLREISLVELRDDYLVSFLFGKDERAHVYGAAQSTYRVDRGGKVTFVTRRLLERDSSQIVSYLPSLVSPLGEWALELFPIHPSRDRYLKSRASVIRWPSKIFWWLAALASLNVVITIFLARSRRLGLRETLTWSITNGVTGIPGLISFLALTKRPKSNLCSPILNRQTLRSDA